MLLGASLNQQLALGGSVMGCGLERIPSLQIPKCTRGLESVRMLPHARPHPVSLVSRVERGLGGPGTSMTRSHSGSDCDGKIPSMTRWRLGSEEGTSGEAGQGQGGSGGSEKQQVPLIGAHISSLLGPGVPGAAVTCQVRSLRGGPWCWQGSP